MPYCYLDEYATADIAFIAENRSLEEVFADAADAVMNTMIEDLSTIHAVETRKSAHRGAEIDLLLFDFLQDLIFFKDSEQLLLRVKEIKIDKSNSDYVLEALLSGESLDPARHEQRVDVKAVTLYQFELKQDQAGNWRARVVLDI